MEEKFDCGLCGKTHPRDGWAHKLGTRECFDLSTAAPMLADYHPAMLFTKALVDDVLSNEAAPSPKDILEQAAECGVISSVPWIPGVHGEHANPDAEPGDPWWDFSPAMRDYVPVANDTEPPQK